MTLRSCTIVFCLRCILTTEADGAWLNLMLQDSTPVDIVADTLDMSPYCSTFARKQLQKPVYKLTAITNHSGSMSVCHYTAQCRSALDDRGYDCNDISVRPDNHIGGPSSSAYLLFYRLQD